jgi:hypothetical protein
MLPISSLYAAHILVIAWPNAGYKLSAPDVRVRSVVPSYGHFWRGVVDEEIACPQMSDGSKTVFLIIDLLQMVLRFIGEGFAPAGK